MALFSGASTNGPFFCERMLLCLPLHDELVGSFVVSRLISKRWLAPWRQWMIALHAAFSSAVRVIDWIHHDTTNRWADSHMTSTSGLPDGDVFVIEVADLTNRGAAIHIHQSDFAGWKFHVSIFTLFRDDLGGGAGTAGHLRTLAGTEFDVVNRGTERNVLQRQ